jgi:hypothetical protein
LQSEDFKRKLALVDKFAKDGTFNLIPALLDSAKALVAVIDEQLAKIEEKIKEAQRLNKDAEVKALTKLKEDVSSSLSRTIGFSASSVRRLSGERALATFAELDDIRELLSKKSVNLEPGTPRGAEPFPLKTAPVKSVSVSRPEEAELMELAEKVTNVNSHLSFQKAKRVLDKIQDPKKKFDLFTQFANQVLSNVYDILKTKPVLENDHPTTASSLAHKRTQNATEIMRRCIDLSDETIGKLDQAQKLKIGFPKVESLIHNKLHRDLSKLGLDANDGYFKYVLICLASFQSTLKPIKELDKYFN